MSDSPKKQRSTKKSTKSAQPEKKFSSTSKSTYVTPFTFDKSRIDVVKATKVDGKTPEGTPYSHYDIEVKYKYPNGTVGKLLAKFKGVQIRNFICKDEVKEFKVNDEKKSVKLEKMVAGLVFDPSLNDDEMPRYKYDPDTTDTTITITQAEITEQSLEFYNDLVSAIAEKLADKVPWYDGKNTSAIVDLGAGSKPDHPKDKNTEKPILTRPKQIYYDIKSYAFVDSKTNEIKKVQGKFKSITGTEFAWSEIQNQTIDGDIFIEFNRCTAKKAGWSIKGNIDPVIVTDMTERVNYSDQVSKEALAEYRDDELALSKMAQREQKLRERLQELRLKNDQVKEKPDKKTKSKKADSDDEKTPPPSPVKEKKKSKSKKVDSDDEKTPPPSPVKEKKKKSKSPPPPPSPVKDDSEDDGDDDIKNILGQK